MTDESMIELLKIGANDDDTLSHLAAFRLEGFIQWTAEWEAIRQTVNCPTCDGSQRINDPDFWGAVNRGAGRIPCPACPDGKIPMARLVAVGAAVFGTPPASGGNPYDPNDTSFIYADGYNTALHELLAVKP